MLAMLVLLLSAQLVAEANAQGLSTYLESSGTGLKPRSNAGLAVETDRLRMRADFALRAQHLATAPLGTPAGGSTEVVPNLRSSLTLAKNLDLETRVNFAEWNARSNTTFDTRVRYRKSLDSFFFDELDGSLWRSPDGLTKQTLRLGFKQILGDYGGIAPLTITGQAIFETTEVTAATGVASDSRKIGVETRLAGFPSAFLATHQALTFKVEKTSGAQPTSASAVSYDQSWTVSPMTKLGLNLGLLRRSYAPANDFEPSLNLSWRSQF